MSELRTTDSTIDELLSGIGDLSPREQAAVLRIAEDTEGIGRRTNFARPQTQEWLANRLVQKEKAIAYERAAAGLFEDLTSAGINVAEVSDLERESFVDSRAVALLLKWLALTDNLILKKHIVSALGRPWAGTQAVDALVAEFGRLNEQNDPGPNTVRVAIIAALEHHAAKLGPEFFLAVASDPANELARAQAIQVLGTLTKYKDSIIPRLLEFLSSDDANAYLESATVLGRWRALEARDRIQELIDTTDERHTADPDHTLDPDFERDELRKALWKIVPR